MNARILKRMEKELKRECIELERSGREVKRPFKNIIPFASRDDLSIYYRYVDYTIALMRRELAEYVGKKSAFDQPYFWEKLVDSLPDAEVTSSLKEEIRKAFTKVQKPEFLNAAVFVEDRRMLNMFEAWADYLQRIDENVFSVADAKALAKFEKALIRVCKKVYYAMKMDANVIRDALCMEWEDLLEPITYDDETVFTEWGILVSMFRDNGETKSDVISCSYITQDHIYVYENRRIGWYFAPSAGDIIAMMPFDDSTGVEKVKYPAAKNYAITNVLYLMDDKWFVIGQPYALPLYKPQQLLQREDYNEVVLKGDVLPDGVFVMKVGDERDKRYEERAREIACKNELPLIICENGVLTVEC